MNARGRAKEVFGIIRRTFHLPVNQKGLASLSLIEQAIKDAIEAEREAISQKAEAKAKEIEPDDHDRGYAENDSAGFNADRQTARALREFAQEIRKSKGD